MKENKFTKEYQLWTYTSYENWSYTEYDTLDECISHPKYGHDWKISRKVDFEIKPIN